LYFFTDETDKQKRELLSARQAKEAAEHQCTTEVFIGKVVLSYLVQSCTAFNKIEF